MEDIPKRLIRLAIRTPSDALSDETVLGTDVSTHTAFKGIFERLTDTSPDVVRRTLFSSMQHTELCLLKKAFAQALGRDDPYPNETRADLIAALTEDYRVFGLARGPHQTAEFVREFEKAAASQANARTI